MAEVNVVAECCGDLCEGPHWDEATNRLLWVDILGKAVHLLDPETGKDQKYVFDGPIGAAVPREKSGSVAVACGRDFLFLDLETGKQEIVATADNDKPGNRFNDGKCDPAGRFWAGTMGPEPSGPTSVETEQGTLFSLDVDQTVKGHTDKITISNGMAWSPDSKTLYYIDSAVRSAYAFDYDTTSGTICNRRTAVQVDPSMGFPDGMTIDVEGMLWIAMYDGGKIVRFDPSTGQPLTTVTFPVTKTTSCCWMGPNYDELIVTSERIRLSPEEKEAQPLAGSIFKVKNLGTRGYPCVPYRG